MSLAAITRREVRKTPYLYDAIRAGIVNYSAAARMLDLEGQDTAVSVSLQRLNKELPPLEMERIDANITISSDETNQQVKIMVEGPVDAKILSHLILVCHMNEIRIIEASISRGEIQIVVEWKEGPNSLRIIERALESIPV
ncbi:hypothetical protein [Candidatus Hikarchaeum yamanae]|uniref:DUF7523 family protein n=1 Tax=Candidatus Hikarchaeum yamanae TaxID=2675326 RepID=UPI0039EB15E6|tara:strand:- start:11424 stop:11846 length:423 start_codon:yes stop_codon:yes gene_type:complete